MRVHEIHAHGESRASEAKWRSHAGARAERPLPPCDTMHQNAQTGNAACVAARSAASVALAFAVAFYGSLCVAARAGFLARCSTAARRRGARGERGSGSECDAGQGGTTQPGPGGPRDCEAGRRHASAASKASGTRSGPTRRRRADKPRGPVRRVARLFGPCGAHGKGRAPCIAIGFSIWTGCIYGLL